MRTISTIGTLSAEQLKQYGTVLELDLLDMLDKNPSAEMLRALHQAHTTHIAFSTLSHHEGEEPSGIAPYQPQEMTLNRVFQDVIIHRKGGTCVSLNLLFASLLKSLGFEVYGQNGHVMYGVPEKRPAASHRFTTVKLGESIYLADVGFGGSPGLKDPLMVLDAQGQLTEGTQGSGLFQYQFSRDADNHIVLSHIKQGKLQPMYAFDFDRTYAEEEYQHPEVEVKSGIDIFITKCPLTMMPVANGRLMLFKDIFTVETGDNQNIDQKQEPISAEEMPKLLLNAFKLNYPNGKFNALSAQRSAQVLANPDHTDRQRKPC